MSVNSDLLSAAIDALASLPGIGKKSAMRIALHLLEDQSNQAHRISEALSEMKDKIQRCKNCHNISDQELCSICLDPARKKETICVVEGITDLMAIEETKQYNGVYHILGGVISPLDGIGPENLNIDSLLNRIDDGEISELIMAINPTIDGETTIFYLSKKVHPYDIQVSLIARGVAFGGELQYTDEITLGRSIHARVPYRLNGQ